MRLPKQVVRIANAVTNLALLVGITRPPYTRQNALIDVSVATLKIVEYMAGAPPGRRFQMTP
jgi:hypothetical protein